MPGREIPAAEPTPSGEPRAKILVVDDAPMFREIETVFLGRTGRILTASDGGEAFEIAQRERPDLVLTDLLMREMDGDELCRRIRHDADLRRVPVVVVTSGNSAEEHERAVRAGADGVVSKPLCRVSLLQVVNFLRSRAQLRARLVRDEVRLSGRPTSGAFAKHRAAVFVETDDARPD
jgi:chemosensory pili system protein ChpA (sensor histidine kinase/response regulator)